MVAPYSLRLTTEEHRRASGQLLTETRAFQGGGELVG